LAGVRPSVQPQLAILLKTDLSLATMVIGTSWLAFWPTTTEAGWWSPRKTMTRLSSPYFWTNEIRLSTEYAMDFAYASLMSWLCCHSLPGPSAAATIGP
jgi:hypothetical protein